MQKLFFDYTFFSLSFISVNSVLPVYFTDILCINNNYVGFYLLFGSFASKGARILGAPFISLLPTKLIYPILCGTGAVGYFILATSTSFFFICCALLMIGFGYGSNSIYTKAALADPSLPNTLNYRYAKLNVCLNIAAAIGPLVATWLFTTVEPLLPFMISAALVTIAGLVALIVHNGELDMPKQGNLLAAFKAHICSLPLNLSFILTVIIWASYAQISSSVPLFVNEHLKAFQWFGPLLTLNAILVIFFSIPISNFFTKMNTSEYDLCGIGFILFACSFIVMYYSQSIFMMSVAIIVFTFAEILIIPTVSAILITHLPDGLRVGILSWNALAVALGEGSGKWIGVNAISNDSYFADSNPFILLSIIPLSGFILIIIMKFIPINKK